MRMKVMAARTLVGLVALAAGLIEPAGAAPWKTSQGNIARTSYLGNDVVTPPFAVVWEYENAEVLDGAPVVAIGRVFLSDAKLNVWALDFKDGSMLWKQDEEDSLAEAHCYDAVTGKLRWSQHLDGRMVHCPQFGYRMVFVVTDAGTLYAFGHVTGKLLWSRKIPPPASMAAVDRNIVAIGSGSILFGLEATTGDELFKVDLGAEVEGVPVLADEGVYVVAGGGVVAIDLAGRVRWRAKLYKPAGARLAVTKRGVLACSLDGSVALLSRADGSEIWEEVIAGSPTMVSGAGDIVFVGTKRSILFGLSLVSGAKMWSMNLERASIDGIALSEGRLIAVSGKWVCALMPAPPPPENLLVTSEDRNAVLTWDASEPNGSPISAYRVFRRRGASDGLVAVVSAPTLEFKARVLPGVIAYRVSAIAENGAESVRSAKVTLEKGEQLICRLNVYPKPFDPRRGPLHITFELRERARVVWDVVDTEGRVRIEERTIFLPPGRALLNWEGVDRTRHEVEPGVYKVRVRAFATGEMGNLARAFPVRWRFDETSSGLPGGPGHTGPVRRPIRGGGQVDRDDTTSAADAGDGKGNQGVRDHGAGEGRDGHGQGKGRGKGPDK